MKKGKLTKKQKKKLKELKKNPQMLVYSEERSIWETIVAGKEREMKQLETAMKYEKAILSEAKKKLEKIKKREERKNGKTRNSK